MPGDTISMQDTPASCTPAVAQEPSRVDDELYFSIFTLRLLIILCLGALASFPLAPHLLIPPLP